MMTLREPPALTEPPEDSEFHAWYEHADITGDLDEWAQDWAATCDPENYSGDVRKAVEELLNQMVEVFTMTPEFGDRYNDRHDQ